MSKGILYMIPTTLGESDVTKVLPQSVKDTIHQLDEFIVENSKNARAFLKLMDIPTPQDQLKLHELNKHTDAQELHAFLANCRNGKNIGLISDAGCPGVADPGAEIANLAHKEDIKIIPLVGPSSILLSLMASGMNGQSFAFNGYLPIDKSDVKKKLKDLERISRTHNQTQLFIETPYRNNKLIETLYQSLQGTTKLCIACDISLKTEYIKTRTIAEWKKTAKPELHKRPCIFLIHAQ
ncbi:MAG: SAM-dependent methyltransferase [Flavobacteriales bacterium]|jgi:16S rRNA (cytidine1402-2'-O)-methyltransferase|tara:strand:+ start:4320 stop:5033 length:714 start_codon:yes stop_codon:yes gene_type:complete